MAAWPTLTVLGTVTLACSWAEASNTNLFDNKVLSGSCNLLDTVLKVKSRRLSEYTVVIRVSAADPVITRLAWSCGGCHRPASREGVLLHVASLGKDPHSKLQVPFH